MMKFRGKKEKNRRGKIYYEKEKNGKMVRKVET